VRLFYFASLPEVNKFFVLSQDLIHVFKRGRHHLIKSGELATIGRGAFARNSRESRNLKGHEEFLKSRMNREAGSFSGGVDGEIITQKKMYLSSLPEF